MKLFQPKSKIHLSESLKEQLDDFEPNVGKGVSVYTHKDEVKKQTFADLVGDDVYFGNEEEKNGTDEVKKSGGSKSIVELMVLLVLLALVFATFYIVFKFLI